MTAGHSGTPQAMKLGIKPGSRVCLDHRPLQWSLTEPPPDIVILKTGAADIVISFFAEAAELPGRLPELGRWIFPAAALWIAWPRRAGGHRSDITDERIRADVLPLGLVDVKVAAIDDDWSGLKVVWRKENR